MRVFIGVELDDQIKARVAAIADLLRATLGPRVQARWIPPSNLHLTLWFIGELADDRAAGVIAAIDAPFAVPAFGLELRGAGAFPASGTPRVLWIRVASGQDSMVRLYNELASRLEPLGFPRERRPYSPHLTIARVKAWPERAARVEGRAALGALSADAGACRVAAITVFRSRLSPKGAAYEPLLRIPLQ